MQLSSVVEQHFARFGRPSVVVRAPGRINLIGEHTDYNEGFVLPAAIDKSVFLCLSPRNDRQMHLHASDIGESIEVSLTELAPIVTGSWANYLLGGVDQLLQQRRPVQGFNLTFGGDLAQGAGMSSSAAIESGLLFALNELFHFGLSAWEIVQMAQRAEHRFAGVQCGIMDMFASVFGQKDRAMRLDCRSLEFEYIPLVVPECKLVMLNSNVKHSLASSEYNTRRRECEQGVRWLQETHPDVHSLRDATPDMLDRFVAPRDQVVHRRCRFVMAENERVLGACRDLQAGRLIEFGQKMFASHEGLRHDYEVSCPEIDFLVDFVRGRQGVLGARMMGGGFGGCTINLVQNHAIEPLVEAVEKAYLEKTGLPLTVYMAETANGVGLTDVF